MDIRLTATFKYKFYGEEYYVYQASDDHEWYAPLSPICEALGVDRGSQLLRIRRDEGIQDKLRMFEIETPYRDTVRVQEAAFLSIKAVPYWLGTIEAARVKEEYRKKVILYKREFVDAAWAVFRSAMFDRDVLAEMDSQLSEAQRAYHEVMDQVLDMKNKMDLITGRFDAELVSQGASLNDVRERLGKLEMLVGDEVPVNTHQGRRIQLMIAAVAESKARATGMPKAKVYPDVQVEFKNQFKIPSYMALPQTKMQEAVRFLGNRWQKFNPGLPLPALFRDEQQDSLL